MKLSELNQQIEESIENAKINKTIQFDSVKQDVEERFHVCYNPNEQTTEIEWQIHLVRANLTLSNSHTVLELDSLCKFLF